MPVLTQASGEKIWRRRTTGQSLALWVGWLLGVAVFVWAWNTISETTTWFFVWDAPRIAGDILGRAMPPKWSYIDHLWWPIWDTLNIATLGTLIALVLAVPVAFLAARNTTPSALFVRPVALFVIVATRSINSLIWALLLIAIIGPGVFAGIVAIDLTLDGLSHYLAERLVSPGSISFILDAQGNVIANSAERVSFHDDNGRLRLPHVSDWADPLAGIAYSQRARAAVDGQTFFLTHDGAEYAASLQPIAATRDKAWQVLVIAPMDDFNAAIRFSNQRLLLAGLGMTLAQIVVIWFLARRMATPLERLVTHVERIRELNRDPMTDLPRSRIREIAALSKAVETLDAAIRTFASFVPVSLVRDLLQTEQQISIGGSSRFLTVFFSDIEGFSELSETIPAQELVERISDYLSIATAEVNREGGTIDKFIGDGVMAFWGAPNVIDDHALCACVAAMRVSHAIDRLNDDLEHRGRKPLNIRIGIHSDAVVVGNIGSSERLNYTVLGDGVNIAARLEALNKAYGTRICISHAVYREAGSALWVRPMGEVQVKGRRAQIIVYELMGIMGHGPDLEPSADRQLLARLTWEAFDLRCAGDAAGARALYARILESFPDDPVARGNLADLSETASA